MKARQVVRFGLKHKKRLLLFASGLVLCGVSAAMLLQRFMTLHAPYTLNPNLVITNEVNGTSEASIPSNAAYVVPANQPRQILLPTIHEQAFIQQVGVAKDGSMAVPGNINLAGWYVKSVKPGDQGLSIIDGHVHGKYAPGVFVALDKLKPGDELSVQYGDSTTRKFQVVSTKVVSLADATNSLFQRDNSVAAQLNLITCTSYNRKTNSYDKRLIVVAKKI